MERMGGLNGDLEAEKPSTPTSVGCAFLVEETASAKALRWGELGMPKEQQKGPHSRPRVSRRAALEDKLETPGGRRRGWFQTLLPDV